MRPRRFAGRSSPLEESLDFTHAMSEKETVSKLDDLLRPLGFMRQEAVWNRRSGHFIEVIDLQVSGSGDTATINAGVLDTDAHAKLWGSEPPASVEEAACTVRARVGELVDGKDLWWRLSDDRVGERITGAVADRVLPYLERMRSRQEMVQWLTDTQVVKKRYPPPIINLAILHGFLGASAEACALLAEVERKAIGAWRTRAAEVAERLGCAS